MFAFGASSRSASMLPVAQPGCARRIGPVLRAAVQVATEPARVGDGPEVSGEPIQVVRPEFRGERLLVRLRDRSQRGQALLALRGEVQGMPPPVILAGASFDEAVTLQSIQDGNDAAGADAQVATRVLLPDTGPATDQPKQTGFRRCDAEGREGPFERNGGIRTQLRQKEGDTTRRMPAHASSNSSWGVLFIMKIIHDAHERSPMHSYSASSRSRFGGPHAGVVGLVSIALLVSSLIVVAALSGGETIRSPFGETADVTRIFTEHSTAVRWAAMLQLGSSIPLGIYTAIMHAHSQRLGIRVPGPTIALFGGTVAAVMLAVSAVITWTQSQQPVVASEPLEHALAYASFAAGGIAHVLGLGLIVAGIAIPGLMLRTLPAPFAWVGLAFAVVAEVSFLTMVFEPVQFLIPIGRFGSLIWLVTAGFLLPRARRSENLARSPGRRT